MSASTMERRSSKSRLSKQDEVEEEDTSPSSDVSDSTIVAGNDGAVEESQTESTSDKESSTEYFVQSAEGDEDEEEEASSPQGTNPRVKLLVRSEALRDDSSPPPDQISSNQNKSSRRRLEKEDSQGSEQLLTPVLSRDSSVEMQYTDSTGIDLEDFIRTTLNKNPKDRMMLFKLESDLTDFIKQNKQNQHKFSPMSSYHRMLVHRVSAFFGLEHNVDPSGKCVIVNMTTSTRIPDFKFKELLDEGSQEDQPRRLILRREGHSADEGRGYRLHSMNGKKSKSFEEREEEYHKVRERIFRAQDSQSSQEGLQESPVGSKTSSRGPSARSSREDLRWSEIRPWSSTESSGYGTDTTTNRHLAPRANSTGAMSSGRMTSSGTQDSMSSLGSSIGSPMSRPPTIPCSPPPAPGEGYPPTPSPHGSEGLPTFLQQGQVFWVASNLEQVPPGSVLINPQTGQPYYNKDGSVYRHYVQAHSQQAPPPPQATPPQQTPIVQPVYQQYSQPPVVLERKSYPQESPGPDLSQQFAGMAMQSQDSIQEAPPSSQSVQYPYVVSQPSIPQQPVGAQQPGYVQQQVPYYPPSQPSNPSQPVRYLYSMQYAPQGQSSTESQPATAQAPYASQSGYPPNYHVISYQQPPQEGYPPQTYTQPSYQSESTDMTHYNTSQPGYGSQPGYYSVPTTSASTGPHVITYVSQQPPGTQFRPPSPSQGPPPNQPPYINYNYAPQQVPTQSHNPHVVPFPGPANPQGLTTVARLPSVPGTAPLGGQFPNHVMTGGSPRMPYPEVKDCNQKTVVYSNVNTVGMSVPPTGQVRPHVQQLYAPRQRLPSPSNPVKPRSKKGWSSSPSSSKDSANHSPHTSTDSSDSGCQVLEVYELNPGVRGEQADRLLEDLVKQGAQLQYFKDNKNVSHFKDNYLLGECIVLALFENDLAAQNVLANHRSRNYKLRMLQRPYDVDQQS